MSFNLQNICKNQIIPNTKTNKNKKEKYYFKIILILLLINKFKLSNKKKILKKK